MPEVTVRKTITIDIDDVIAKTTEAVRLWANGLAGADLNPEDYYVTELGYWEYYEAVWKRHGLDKDLSFAAFLKTMDIDQDHIAVMDEAKRVIGELKKYYNLVFITARQPEYKDSTRRWLDERIDAEIPLYLSRNPFANIDARSKGELCAELGVDVLIDDSVDNCHSALQYGVEALLFGEYGWNAKAPHDIRRCASWRDVEEYLLLHEQ